jgi:ubiquinone/menaquinone biosynthesis C-methylase UbiE
MRASRQSGGWRFHFHRFDAVGQRLENVDLRWRFDLSRIATSMSELAMLVFWKAAYRMDDLIPSVKRPLLQSIMDVYVGVRIPESNLRSQIAAIRNDWRYETVGAGIDVGFVPDAPVPEWAMMSEWFKDAPQKRLHMQMYMKVTSRTVLKGKRVLEVGCGQGDGAAFLTQIRPPAKYVAVDLHPTQIALAHTAHARFTPTLVFQPGDAQRLPLTTDTFDVVINVESSHSYPRFDEFVSEVYRVLAPGGAFCFSDLRKVVPGQSCATKLGAEFEHAGFAVEHHEDITRNARRSLDELKDAGGGRLWAEFAALQDLFKRGLFEYHHFVLRKPVRAGARALQVAR